MQQTTVVAVIHFLDIVSWLIRVDILNDITSKILGGALPWTSPFINIGGTCPPCFIGIDAPDLT